MRIIKLITTVLLSALLLTACNGTSDSYNTKVTVDYEIDSATSANVNATYNSVLSDLRSGGNPDSVIALPDKQYMPDNAEDAGRVMEFSPEISLSDIVVGEQKVVSEIHIIFGKNIETEQHIDVNSPSNFDDAGFSFALEPYTREMYIVLSSFSIGAIDYLVYSAFANTDAGWKLYELRYDEYAYESMNAAELYQKAEDLNDNQEIVPAAVYAYCAGRLLTPCGIVSSDNETIAEAIEPLVAKVNQKYKFPYELSLEDEPEDDEQDNDGETLTLFGFEPVVTEHGIEVAIKYFTEIDIEDLVTSLDADEDAEPLTAYQQSKNEKTVQKLEDEAKLIIEHINRSFAGITNEFDNVYMAAYNRFEVEVESDEKSNAATDKEPEKEYEYILYLFRTPTEVEEEIA